MIGKRIIQGTVMRRIKGQVLFRLGLVLSVILIGWTQDCSAGVVIRQVMRDREGRVATVVLYYSEEKLRTDDEDSQLTTIMDYRGNRITLIDHRARSYVETSLSEWEKEVARRMKVNRSPVTPGLRKIVVKRTEETETINGFRTEKVQVFADGQLIEENWVTRDVDLKEIERVMERVAKGFSREFSAEMGEGQEIHEKMKPYGFPIMVKDYSMAHGLGIKVSEVIQLEEKDLGGEVFSPPMGYVRIMVESPRK
jgi:hypothetical protein